MCGIAGTCKADFDVETALDLIAHRGPDGRGVTEHEGVVHGHVRLAIQDLSDASLQPFRYRDGVLSYNGELWAPDALRSELEARGHRFTTTGDTEVLAAALWEWGPSVLDRLDGMFCFSWSRPGVALLVRDRLGKLPLYVLRSGDGHSWCSERKGFGPDRGNAEALTAGHWLDLLTGKVHRYYSIPKLERPDAGTVETLIAQGVEKRLISDAPVCVLLSGGLDSSLTTAMVAKIRPDVVAYTCFVWPDSPDLASARLVAEHLGIEHREVQLPEPDDAALVRAVRTVEVPNRTSIETATLCIPLAERLSRDGFKVAVSGEAADELFGGYGTLARRATSDEAWREARLEFFAKMGRADFHRVNKSFMAHGVEVRLPFCERGLVETVMSLGRKECPSGKKSLAAIAEAWLPRSIARRKKETFHGAAGLRGFFDAAYPNPTRYYNSLVRNEFGRIVRG